jgi:osmotically-inducible protein OsmY
MDGAHVWLCWRGKQFDLTEGLVPEVPFLVSDAPAESPFTIHTGSSTGPTSGPLTPLFPRDRGAVRYSSNCRCGRWQRHEVSLTTEIINESPGTTLAFDFQTVEEEEQDEIVVPLMQDDDVSSRASSQDTPTPVKYLVLPGNYSGDSWACVAAMLLDPTIHVILTAKDSLEDLAESTDYDKIAAQFLEFAKQTEGVTNVNDRLHVTVGGMGQQGSDSAVASQATQAITDHKKADADPLIGWTFSSTSVIMRAAERMGVAALRSTLVGAFTAKSEAYDALVGRIASQGPCVLLNMRVGRPGNHPQHNMTKTIYSQLKKQITSAGFKIVRIGTYQNSTWTPKAQWMQDLKEDNGDGILIEIFPSGERADRRHTSYFWASVAKLPDVLGVMGGRSGSLDIAAFMGVRTFCWDIEKRDDAGFHEYVRQLLMFPIMSIGRRCTPKTLKGGHYFDQKKPAPTLGLETLDVDCWLTGHHILPAEPLHPEDLTKCLPFSKGVPTGRTRLLLVPLVYVEDLVDWYEGFPASKPAASSDDDDELGLLLEEQPPKPPQCVDCGEPARQRAEFTCGHVVYLCAPHAISYEAECGKCALATIESLLDIEKDRDWVRIQVGVA